jgi:hypothetical protein
MIFRKNNQKREKWLRFDNYEGGVKVKTITYLELLQKIKNKEIKENQKVWLSYGGRIYTYQDGDLIDDFTSNSIHDSHCLESLLENNCRFATEDLDKLIKL